MRSGADSPVLEVKRWRWTVWVPRLSTKSMKFKMSPVSGCRHFVWHGACLDSLDCTPSELETGHYLDGEEVGGCDSFIDPW